MIYYTQNENNQITIRKDQRSDKATIELCFFILSQVIVQHKAYDIMSFKAQYQDRDLVTIASLHQRSFPESVDISHRCVPPHWMWCLLALKVQPHPAAY